MEPVLKGDSSFVGRGFIRDIRPARIRVSTPEARSECIHAGSTGTAAKSACV